MRRLGGGGWRRIFIVYFLGRLWEDILEMVTLTFDRENDVACVVLKHAGKPREIL